MDVTIWYFFIKDFEMIIYNKFLNMLVFYFSTPSEFPWCKSQLLVYISMPLSQQSLIVNRKKKMNANFLHMSNFISVLH